MIIFKKFHKLNNFVMKTKKQIVIIEDKPSFVFDALHLLRERYDITILPTIAHAIQWFFFLQEGKVEKPDILLSDIHLPGTPVSDDVETIEKLILATDLESFFRSFHQKREAFSNELNEARSGVSQGKAAAAKEKNLLAAHYYSSEEGLRILREIDQSLEKMNRLYEEVFRLSREVDKEIPVGFIFALKGLMVQIPLIGLLKSSAHGMPPLTWFAEVLFHPRFNSVNNITEHEGTLHAHNPGTDSRFITNNTFGDSKLVMSIDGLSVEEDVFGVRVLRKRWDLLVDELLKTA